jgi:hypothetical protein
MQAEETPGAVPTEVLTAWTKVPPTMGRPADIQRSDFVDRFLPGPALALCGCRARLVVGCGELPLEANGVANSGVQHFADGVMAPGPDRESRDYGSFIFFENPDGNSWAVQQVRQHVR